MLGIAPIAIAASILSVTRRRAARILWARDGAAIDVPVGADSKLVRPEDPALAGGYSTSVDERRGNEQRDGDRFELHREPQASNSTTR
ncbi:hypothetical protein MKK88_17625 [Methylobacterium sp. E-005]|nr:hypothetical protein [Methylobacterium sp. E-005]MCJ2087786.1 hypothetical protein [Methylobacterium sp. E-005]